MGYYHYSSSGLTGHWTEGDIQKRDWHWYQGQNSKISIPGMWTGVLWLLPLYGGYWWQRAGLCVTRECWVWVEGEADHPSPKWATKNADAGRQWFTPGWQIRLVEWANCKTTECTASLTRYLLDHYPGGHGSAPVHLQSSQHSVCSVAHWCLPALPSWLTFSLCLCLNFMT